MRKRELRTQLPGGEKRCRRRWRSSRWQRWLMNNHLEHDLYISQNLPLNQSIRRWGKTLGHGGMGEQSLLKNQTSFIDNFSFLLWEYFSLLLFSRNSRVRKGFPCLTVVVVLVLILTLAYSKVFSWGNWLLWSVLLCSLSQALW